MHTPYERFHGLCSTPLQEQCRHFKVGRTVIVGAMLHRSKRFRRNAETVFLHGATGSCGRAEISFLHSGTVLKPYPGKTFRSADDKSGIRLPQNSDMTLHRAGHNPLRSKWQEKKAVTDPLNFSVRMYCLRPGDARAGPMQADRAVRAYCTGRGYGRIRAGVCNTPLQ